jgi:hypothetical protein
MQDLPNTLQLSLPAVYTFIPSGGRVYLFQNGWNPQNGSKKLDSTSACSVTNKLISSTQCNIVEVDIYTDTQMYQPLIDDLFELPIHFKCLYNVNNFHDENPVSCFHIESEKERQNKMLMKSKFSYPRIDPSPPPSKCR